MRGELPALSARLDRGHGVAGEVGGNIGRQAGAGGEETLDGGDIGAREAGKPVQQRLHGRVELFRRGQPADDAGGESMGASISSVE